MKNDPSQEIDATVIALARKSDVSVPIPGDVQFYSGSSLVTVGQVRKIKEGGYAIVIKRDGRRPAWRGGPSLYHYLAVPCGPPLAARQDARRRAIILAVQHSPQAADPRLQKWDQGEMLKCWGESRMGGHEALWAGTTGRLVYETGHYDDGPAVWLMRDTALAAEAISLQKEP